MYSSKENFKHTPTSHFKTPYSRPNTRGSDLIVSKIINKPRTSENNYGRSVIPSKPFSPRNSQPSTVSNFRESPTYESLSEGYRVTFTSRYAESIKNQFECEQVHFRPRKSQVKNKTNDFENFLELKMMSIGDGEEVMDNSEKSKPETGQETQSKGFQIKNRQNLFRIFTGTVENVLHWSKLKTSHNILFEVIGIISVIQTGKWASEKIFYLTDSKTGFRLQVVYHEIDRSLPKLSVNSLVTCVGRLLTRNRLQAYKVEEGSEEKKNYLERLSFICNRVADELAASIQKK